MHLPYSMIVLAISYFPRVSTAQAIGEATDKAGAFTVYADESDVYSDECAATVRCPVSAPITVRAIDVSYL